VSAGPDVVVVAPPPTPNGDLHVGHLAGPYLAADVFTRFERLRGRTVVSAISTDENQSYVVTTAERLGRSPRELASESHAHVQRTLERAGIAFDLVGRPDDAYASFVKRYLDALTAAGAFVERRVEALVDARTGRQLAESYVGGRCPVCFLDTRGNICESCGHPNDPSRLVQPYVVGGEGTIEATTSRALVLPLERYRPQLERCCAGRRLRPHLQTLIGSLLERPLPDFPITYRSQWGIALDRPDWETTVYNVWAEMYPGHLHWTQRAYAERSLWEAGDGPRYVQFIGFDNSFFYAIAHVAIGLAAEAANLPAAPFAQIVTNQFYLLEQSKFSSSQGHAIWGRDLLADWAADPVRLYLCLTNPETQESNFALAEMESALETRLLRPFERVRRVWNRLVGSRRVHTAADGRWAGWQPAFQRRFELSYDPETFSLRRGAETLTAYLDFLASELERADADGDRFPASALGQLAVYAAPLMPGFAAGLAEHAGIAGPLSWDAPPVQREAELRPIPPDLLEPRQPRLSGQRA
jgi:methionyl-tRNA synthetase